MYLKSLFTLLLFSILSIVSFGQEEESVLNAPDNWKGEIIPFPLGFAPSIDFVGIEDLRFAPGWADSTSQEFWAYTFVWYIDKTKAMTVDILTESFNSYYDGLMGVDENKLDKTQTNFSKVDGGFTGEMRVYDRFFTKQYMILNIMVKESFCTQTDKQIVSCYISPKGFDHDVWGIFDAVTLKVTCD